MFLYEKSLPGSAKSTNFSKREKPILCREEIFVFMPIYLSVFKVEVSITKETSLFKFNCASALGTDVKKNTKPKHKTYSCKITSIKKGAGFERFFSKTTSLSFRTLVILLTRYFKTINYNRVLFISYMKY